MNGYCGMCKSKRRELILCMFRDEGKEETALEEYIRNEKKRKIDKLLESRNRLSRDRDFCQQSFAGNSDPVE